MSWRYDEGAVGVINVGDDDGDVRAGHAFEGQVQGAAAVVLRPILKSIDRLTSLRVLTFCLKVAT